MFSGELYFPLRLSVAEISVRSIRRESTQPFRMSGLHSCEFVSISGSLLSSSRIR